MKELIGLEGGRYTYLDDLINMQESALSFASIFMGCDNFVIGGCEVSGSSISEGYVFINGKIRKFSGATGISQWPQYIYEYNTVENVRYATETQKVGRNIYGCAIAAAIPTTPDTITQLSPEAITVQSTGAINLKDAFFGKYALLLDQTAKSQIVKGVVNFLQDVQVNGVNLGDIYAKKSYVDTQDGLKCDKTNYYTKAEIDALLKTRDTTISDIDAREWLTQDAGDARYAMLSELLSDMAIDDDRKRQIRVNIGAEGAGNYQPVENDTGWVWIVQQTEKSGLECRQKGNTVSIQGVIYIDQHMTYANSRPIFTLPNNIAPPKYSVTQYLSCTDVKYGLPVKFSILLGTDGTCYVDKWDGYDGTADTSLNITYLTE